MTKQKVSASQFFSLLFLSVLSTGFMYISSPQITIAETETLLHPFVFIVVSILVSIPTYFIYRELKKQKEIGMVTEKRIPLKIFALIYGAVYFTGAFRSAARFDLFASSELFPGTDMSLFIIAIVVVCGLLSLLGIGALCRGSVIFSFVVVAVTAFVMISLGDEITMLNFTPLFEDGLGNFFSDSILFCIQTTELGTVLLFLSQITGNIKKHFIGWVMLSALSFVIIFFFVIGSLGVFADTQLFPTYSSVTLADFGLLERIDALETAIWIFCVVSKISFYILIVTECIKYAFSKMSERVACLGVCIALNGILVFVSGNVQRFTFVSNTVLVAVLYGLSAILLPIAILIYLKKVKPYEKKIENN